MLDGLEPQPDGVRHVVLDLRGLTFMDVLGLKELLRQNEFARSNRHNLAVVRGTEAIQRVLALTRAQDDRQVPSAVHLPVPRVAPNAEKARTRGPSPYH